MILNLISVAYGKRMIIIKSRHIKLKSFVNFLYTYILMSWYVVKVCIWR